MWPYAAIALAALLMGFGGGWRVQEWRYEAADAARIAAEVEHLRKAVQEVSLAATEHEADKVQIRTRYKTIDREVAHVVEKPVYRNVCWDADGLRILTGAITGATTPSEPSPTLRGTDTSTRGDRGGNAQVGGGDSQALPGLPEPAQPNR